MQEPSIFTKIITGEIPAHKIYEDELTLAFLDIYAVIEGHTLVIPKKQVEFVWDLDDPTYQALMATTKRVATRLRDVLGTTYIGEKVVGVDVPHAHIHLIPFTHVDDFHRANQQQAEPDHTALADLAQQLAF